MYTLGIHSVYTQCIHGINRNYRDFKLIFSRGFRIYPVYTWYIPSVYGRAYKCSIANRCGWSGCDVLYWQ